MICADDFGLEQEINFAIIDLVEKKQIQAVSILVDAAHLTPEIVEIIKSKDILLGLHLDLFKKNPFKNFWSAIFYQDQLKSEIDRQLNLFMHKFEKHPDYLDGHMHCHIYPFFSEVILQVLPKNIKLRSVILDRRLFQTKMGPAILYLNFLNFWGQRFYLKAKKTHEFLNHKILGVFAGHANTADLMIFKSDSDLLFIHPAKYSGPEKLTQLQQQRASDYEIFQ